jgi:hypothetical protein
MRHKSTDITDFCISPLTFSSSGTFAAKPYQPILSFSYQHGTPIADYYAQERVLSYLCASDPQQKNL